MSDSRKSRKDSGIVLTAIYEVLKRKNGQVTLDIFKGIEEKPDGVLLILHDDLVAVADGHKIKVMGSDITIKEEESSGGPQKQKILSNEERASYARNEKMVFESWDALTDMGCQLGLDENPFKPSKEEPEDELEP